MKHVLGLWSALWAGLLLLIVSATESDPTDASGSGSDSGYLTPYESTHIISPSSVKAVASTSDIFADKTSTSKGEDTTTTPGTSKSFEPTLLATPKMATHYIEITLKISPSDYLGQQIEIKVLQVLYRFLPTNFTSVKRAVNEKYVIILTMDEQKSSNHSSVLQVYLADSETGEEASEATKQFFYLLSSQSAEFIRELEEAVSAVSW